MRALVKNSGDEEQVNAAKEKFKKRRERDLDDLRWVVSHSRGRRFFWRLLSECRFLQISHTADPYETAFREGQRNVGRMFFADLNEADPNAYPNMLAERKVEENG